MVQKLMWLCVLGFVGTLSAQLDLPDQFRDQLDSLGADIIRPLDSDYRSVQLAENRFRPADFVMYSRKEKLEIRYYLQPESSMGHYQGMPHIATGRFLIDVSSNDEDAVTTAHSFIGESFATFNADWAKLFTFRPKREFSDTNTAQLVALYREGLGIIYIFLCFDKPPDELDTRQLAARFIE